MNHRLYSYFILIVILFCRISQANVKLEESENSYFLSNNKVEMKVQKNNASIIELKNYGAPKNLLMPYHNRYKHGSGYIQMVSHKGYTEPVVDKSWVLINTSEMVDIAFRQDNEKFPFVVEIHYVMREDTPGFYTYIIAENNPSKCSRGSLIQLNSILKMNTDIFSHSIVHDWYYKEIVTVEQQKKEGRFLMDMTYQFPNGRIFSKYDLCDYEDRKFRYHGVVGDGIGVWIIQGSGEHLTGGPTTQELTTHNGMLLRHFTACHFGSGTIDFEPTDGKWAKLAGPWLTYINTGSSHENMRYDAERKSGELMSQWPYRWLKHKLYPLERGIVKGKVNIQGISAYDSMVILAQPEDRENNVPEWQMQGKDYFFWSWCDREGNFSIGKVRPGQYSLYVLNDNAFGEKRVRGVSVKADEVTDLGTIDWIPETKGNILWQIGIPDRTSAEFLHGNEPRQYGRWLKYKQDFPNDLIFYIGTDDWRKSWNYIHPSIPIGDAKYRMPEWTIVFDCEDQYTSGTAYLRIGIAGVSAYSGELVEGARRYSGLDISINGHNIGECRFYGHDSSGGRGGVKGRYREKLVEFDAGFLKSKNNKIKLKLTSLPLLGIKKGFPHSQLLYDALRLEVNPERNKR